MFKFNIGDKVQDKITGFIGKVTSRTQYITGCNGYGVQPLNLDEKGNPQRAWNMDEVQLELVEAAAQPVDKRAAKTGGPHEAPRSLRA